MKVLWEVDDGYAGGDCHRECYIEDEEIEGMDEEEKTAYIDSCVNDEFVQSISWYITGIEEDE